jgi:hypothetical protein
VSTGNDTKKVFVYFLPAIEQRFINAGGSQKQDNLKTKEPSYTSCYIELERAATYSGHHFLRFQKCLNEANVTKISDFRAGDHGHFNIVPLPILKFI